MSDAGEHDLVLLSAYGLDELLTADDDPALWAAALAQHWPTPGSDALTIDVLRFGVGRVAADGEEVDAKSGMVVIDTWCFTRADQSRLRVGACPPWVQEGASETRPAAPAAPIAGGLAGMLGLPALSLPVGFAYGPVDNTIVVSRPSTDRDEALVYHGMAGGGIGTGETRRWVRRADGRWAMTEERTNLWLT